MSNYIDESLASLAVVSNLTNQMWINEINSDGQEFNYDSQDIYRAHLELVYSLNFNEKIKSRIDYIEGCIGRNAKRFCFIQYNFKSLLQPQL